MLDAKVSTRPLGQKVLPESKSGDKAMLVMSKSCQDEKQDPAVGLTANDEAEPNESQRPADSADSNQRPCPFFSNSPRANLVVEWNESETSGEHCFLATLYGSTKPA